MKTEKIVEVKRFMKMPQVAWGGGAILMVILAVLLWRVNSVLPELMEKNWTTREQSDSIYRIAMDSTGSVWYLRGGNLYSDAGQTIRPPEQVGSAWRGADLALDRQDRLWAATDAGIVAMYISDSDWLVYTPEVMKDYKENYPVKLNFDTRSQIWLEDQDGLSIVELDPATRTYQLKSVYSFAGAFFQLSFNDWMSDRQSGVLVLYQGELLRWQPDRSVSILGKIDGSCVATDPYGKIWVGDHQGRINIYDTYGRWFQESQVAASGITAISIDRQGRTWVGTSADGVLVRQPGATWERINSGNSPLDNTSVTHILTGPDNRVTITTYMGMFVLDPDQMVPLQIINMLILLKKWLPWFLAVIPTGLATTWLVRRYYHDLVVWVMCLSTAAHRRLRMLLDQTRVHGAEIVKGVVEILERSKVLDYDPPNAIVSLLSGFILWWLFWGGLFVFGSMISPVVYFPFGTFPGKLTEFLLYFVIVGLEAVLGLILFHRRPMMFPGYLLGYIFNLVVVFAATLYGPSMYQADLGLVHRLFAILGFPSSILFMIEFIKGPVMF